MTWQRPTSWSAETTDGAWYAERNATGRKWKLWRNARNDALEADIKAMKDRERIDDDIADETDLVSRAAKSGVLRKPGK